MKAEQWQKVKAIVNQALELSAKERPNFLEQAFAQDETLRQEVESLIAFHYKAGNFLEDPAIKDVTNLYISKNFLDKADRGNIKTLSYKDEKLAKDSSSFNIKELVNSDVKLLIGKTLDEQYKIEDLLGVGGMGIVYQANHTLLQRKVAIKIMSPKIMDDNVYKQLFIREGRIATKFIHPNSVNVYDLRESSDGLIYLVLEYVQGQPLDQVLKTGKIFSPKEACKLLAPIASALDTAHLAGIVHRDLKPSNIMVGYNDDFSTTKLLDLGIAKITQQAATSELSITAMHFVLGTPYYMSPEQWEKRSDIDGRADIYSLAIIFYQIIAGKRPFEATTLESLIYQHANEMPKPLNEIMESVPELFSQVVAQAMAKDRNKRPTSCQEFISKLQRALEKQQLNQQVNKNLPLTLPITEEVIGKLYTNKISNTRETNNKTFVSIITISTIAIILITAGLFFVNTLIINKTKDILEPIAYKPLVPNTLLESKDKFTTAKVNKEGEIIETKTKEIGSFVIGLGDKVTMLSIPAGEFSMGESVGYENYSEITQPVHQVKIKAFFISKFEITQKQWQAVALLPKVNIELNPIPSEFEGENLPIENVSWQECQEFCARLSKKTGKNYRLPTEAEWEYAARAGTNEAFVFGEAMNLDFANYNGQQTTNVGNYKYANEFGLLDVHGNVWEWCQDSWHENYKDAPQNESVWQVSEDDFLKVIRGGSWTTNNIDCRLASRSTRILDTRRNDLGFRLALSK